MRSRRMARRQPEGRHTTMGLFFLAACACAGALAVGSACGDDTALVRPRLDGGTDDGAAAEAGNACNVSFPSTYESPTFETNAAQELGLRKAFDDFLAPMRSV